MPLSRYMLSNFSYNLQLLLFQNMIVLLSYRLFFLYSSMLCLSQLFINCVLVPFNKSYLYALYRFEKKLLAVTEDDLGDYEVLGDLTKSTQPKSLGGLYVPGPGVSLPTLVVMRAAVPNLLVPAFLYCDKTQFPSA